MRKTNSGLTLNSLSVIALAFGMLTGCISTEGTVKIEGKVIDESTKTGIPWKNIIVQGVVNSNNKSETIEAGQFSTDSSGRFTYTLKKIKGAYHYNFCFTGNADYKVTVHKMSITDLKRNSKYLFFPLSKLVGLTIKINRKSRTPVCDTLCLTWESDGIYFWFLYPYSVDNYERSNSVGPSPGIGLIWIGGKVNSTVNTKVLADKMTELSWELYRNGRKKKFTDTITCKRDLPNIVYFSY